MSRLESGDVRLASALFDLAKEGEQTEEYLNALKSVKNDFEKEPKLLAVLGSRQIPFEEQYALIDKLYAGKGLLHLTPFLKLMTKKRRISRFGEVLEEYVRLFDANFGIEEGIIYSVKLLSEGEMRSFEALFGEKLGKKIRLKNLTEPSLLGGVRIFIDGKVYDGSLAKKLESLREALIEAENGGNSL